jgi:hypothetical protein
MPDCKRSGCCFARSGSGRRAGCSSGKTFCAVCRDASEFIGFPLEGPRFIALFKILKICIQNQKQELFYDRLSHSPQLVAALKAAHAKGTTVSAESKRRRVSHTAVAASPKSSSNSDSSSSDGGTEADEPAGATPTPSPSVQAPAPVTSTSLPRQTQRVAIHRVHQMAVDVLDQAESPWCTEHAMALGANMSLFGRYGLVCAASKFLDIWLNQRIPSRQWPCEFASELKPFPFRHGDGVHQVVIRATRIPDHATACRRIRRSTGYWHIIVVAEFGTPPELSRHSMTAIRMSALSTGTIVCANSHGTREPRVGVAMSQYVCAYVVQCEVVATTSARTGLPVENPFEDPDWAALMDLDR